MTLLKSIIIGVSVFAVIIACVGLYTVYVKKKQEGTILIGLGAMLSTMCAALAQLLSFMVRG